MRARKCLAVSALLLASTMAGLPCAGRAAELDGHELSLSAWPNESGSVLRADSGGFALLVAQVTLVLELRTWSRSDVLPPVTIGVLPRLGAGPSPKPVGASPWEDLSRRRSDPVAAASGVVWSSGQLSDLIGFEGIEPGYQNSSSIYLSSLALSMPYTGLFTSVPITERLSADLGAVSASPVSWGSPSHAGRLAFAPAKDVHTALGWIIGSEAAPRTTTPGYVLDLVVGYKGVRDLAFGANVNYGQDYEASWYGLAGYVSYAPTRKLRSSFRQEWFVDQDGMRTGYGSRLGLLSTTVSVDYRISPSLFARLEFRREGADRPYFSDRTNPGTTSPTRGTITLSINIARF